MTETTSTPIAFLGAGNIAGPYSESVARHPELDLIGVYDVDPGKARQFAADYACTAYESVDELCEASPVIIVNLSSAPFHYTTTLDLIARRQTVFSEKPLALLPGQSNDLVLAATEAGVRLACAPSIWLGAAQQEAALDVLSGELGHIGLVKAEVNQGRIETWHPVPASFYQVGPVFDAGVYVITYLTAILGPIREVSALSSMSVSDRVTLGGDEFTPPTDDTWVVNARFESGTLLSLTCNFFVDSATQPRTIAFHGDRGSLVLEDWFMPGSAVRRASYGSPLEPSRAADDSAPDWALGVLDLAEAIRDERPHRTGADHAAHVVGVLDAVSASARDGARAQVASSFPSPFPTLTVSTR